MRGKRVELLGQRYGRLTVLKFSGTNISGNAIWKCRCDCGVEFCTLGVYLTTGRTKSCGCLRSERTAARNRIIKRKDYEQRGVHKLLEERESGSPR